MQTQDILKKIKRGTTEIINADSLEKKIKQGRPLLVKAGFDPTAPDIHLGHVVLLRKLRQFQDLGHQVFFLIGDFTAQIGDPSGRDRLRPRMDSREIKENAKTYQKQVFKILDKEKTRVVFNSQWLAKLTTQRILALTAHSTVAQMLARADFKKRFEEGKEISILEFIYPLLQGYDSVHLKADIEIGGSDQKFNLLMGRQLQTVFQQEPQVVIMTPLLEGTDGIRKMSKSLDNTIGIDEAPKEILGKIMSVSDELMYRYYEVLTDCDLREVKALHPKEAKLRLGQEIVRQFYDEAQAVKARKDFERVFSQRQVPEGIIPYKFNRRKAESLVDILVITKLTGSKNEARRLLKQGAVRYNNEKIADEYWKIKKGVLKVGKRNFLEFV